jgi:hypothetical protein
MGRCMASATCGDQSKSFISNRTGVSCVFIVFAQLNSGSFHCVLIRKSISSSLTRISGNDGCLLAFRVEQSPISCSHLRKRNLESPATRKALRSWNCFESVQASRFLIPNTQFDQFKLASMATYVTILDISPVSCSSCHPDSDAHLCSGGDSCIPMKSPVSRLRN